MSPRNPAWVFEEPQKRGSEQCLNIKREFYAHINLSGHLDNLGELNRFLGCTLQVFDGKDLEARVIDLERLKPNLLA
jgi:hypothetical protein